MTSEPKADGANMKYVLAIAGLSAVPFTIVALHDPEAYVREIKAQMDAARAA